MLLVVEQWCCILLLLCLKKRVICCCMPARANPSFLLFVFLSRIHHHMRVSHLVGGIGCMPCFKKNSRSSILNSIYSAVQRLQNARNDVLFVVVLQQLLDGSLSSLVHLIICQGRTERRFSLGPGSPPCVDVLIITDKKSAYADFSEPGR